MPRLLDRLARRLGLAPPGEIRALRGELAHARQVLAWHHDWHRHVGTVGLPDGDGGYVDVDMSIEYRCSSLHGSTVRQLAAGPD